MIRPGGHRRRTLTAVGAGLLLSVGAASGASAQAPAVPAPPAPAPVPVPAPAPVPEPAPAPIPAKLRLSTQGTGGGVLKGDRWRAVVTITPAVPGTKATVTFKAKGGKTRTRTVTLRASKNGKRAVGRLDYRNRGTGRVVVRARIRKGQPAAPVRAKSVAVNQATPSLSPGERGPAVRILQSLLRKKGYVIGKPGTFDARTQRAVIAFRKVAGMQWSSVANEAVFRAARAGKGTFRVRFPKHGRHVEGDIGRQVLVLVGANGKPERIYHTSPGAGATPTIRGSYRVYMRDPGTNAKGMYKSSYFIRGYAIHGYPSVPLYNASHGCFRVPMADAVSIYNWISMGMRVDTY
ncbi:MAG: L,D-transpeptidase family protein [Patulibacter sp.]